MRQFLAGLLLSLTFVPASFGAGITRTDAGACPSIADHQEFMHQMLAKNYTYELPSRCVVLDSQIRVTGPFDRETAKYGDDESTFLLIGVPDGRKLWTLESWVVFDKPKAAGTYYAQSNANVRSKPSLAGTIVGKLTPGATVEVGTNPAVAADGYTWVPIVTPDGQVGWTAQSLLGKTAPARERLSKSGLPNRVKASLSDKTSVKSVAFRGDNLVITLGKRSFDQKEIYPVIKDACRYVSICDCTVGEITVTNMFGGYGYVYERPDRCASLQSKSGRQLEVAIVSYVHMM